MTLMEILIVLAIIGLMVGASVGALSAFTDAEFGKVTAELSSAMRYLYGEAARRNEIYRLAIALDEERYWVEAAPNSPETLSLLASEGTPEENASAEGAQGGDETSATSDTADASAFEGEGAVPPQGFEQVALSALKPKAISPLFFKDVFVSHSVNKVGEGVVYIYFFPNGSTEYTIINISDEDEETFYSVEMNPLTGKTKVRDSYYENPY